MSTPPVSDGPTLGVIVCCRDEAAVIQRRLANLALCDWPPSDRTHRVVIVDDGSSDATAKLTEQWIDKLQNPRAKFELLQNRGRHGKSAAIQCGLTHLGEQVDVIVLTDADVVNAPDALVHLVDAFSASANVGMVSGSQRFVNELRDDGAFGAAQAASASGIYDRSTAWVRALESRFGRVFSVHGQLLAWRADLGLAPRNALAADDLDLMRQVRLAGKRVVLAGRARFFERKPARELMRQAQAVRRARAYVQFAATLDPHEARDGLTRWQWRFYKHVPGALPLAVAPTCFAICVLMGVRIWLYPEGVAMVVLSAMAAITLIGRVVWPKANVIAEAKRLEREEPMEDRWLTAR